MYIAIGQSNTERRNKRQEKGKSIIDFIPDYIVLDVETTGLDPLYDEIIQVGAVRVRDRIIVDQYESLVNPGFEIDSFITDLTGITNEMLANAPAKESIASEIKTFIGDDVIVGHNISFDVNFLYDTFEKVGLPALSNDYLCTKRLAKWLFHDWENYKLKTLVKKLKLPEDRFHNALADTIHAYHAYEYMKKYIIENNVDVQQIIKSKKYTNSARAKDIVASTTDIDPDNPYFNHSFVFTGTLERMDRKDAMQLVVDHGGLVSDTVNKKTNYLVLGDYSQSRNVKGGKTGKLKKAEDLILKGSDLQIISENVFFEMLEEYEQENQ